MVNSCIEICASFITQPIHQLQIIQDWEKRDTKQNIIYIANLKSFAVKIKVYK